MYRIGVDLGGTNIAAAIVSEDYKIVRKMSVPTGRERDASFIMDDMAQLCRDLCAAEGIALSDVEAIGIASPGVANHTDGVVEYSCNLGFRKFPICKELSHRLGIDNIHVENDANAAAWGEAVAGAARGTKNSVMITLGTGVGGGVIMNHKIYAGSANSGGTELGHTVICAGGRQCSCGRRGCLEAYASATALTKMTKEKMEELSLKGIPSKLFEVAEKEGKVSARTAFDAMRLGDDFAKSIVDDYIFYLAEGVTNMINIFQPDILTIGGGVCNEKDYLMVPLLRHVEREQYTRDNKNKTKVMIAALKNDAGIIGAAGLEA